MIAMNSGIKEVNKVSIFEQKKGKVLVGESSLRIRWFTGIGIKSGFRSVVCTI